MTINTESKVYLDSQECDELQRIVYGWFQYRDSEHVREDIKKILIKIGVEFQDDN